MFLQLLTPEQQRAFLQAARAITEEDGEVAEVELGLMAAIAAECQLDEDPPRVSVDELLTSVASIVDETEARNVFLVELAGVVVIDAHADPAEEAAFARFGDALGADAERRARFLEFAHAARDLLETGRELIATETRA